MESGLLNSYRASYVRLPSDAYSSGSDAHTSPESDSRKCSRDSSEREWEAHRLMKVSPRKGSCLSDYEPESDRGFEDGDVDTEENIEHEEYLTDDVASEQVIEDSAEEDYDQDADDQVDDEGPIIHIFAVDPELDLEYSSDENESTECTNVNSISIESHVENDKSTEYNEKSRENEVDSFPKELNEQCRSRVDDIEEYFVKPKLEKHHNIKTLKCETGSGIDSKDNTVDILSKEKLSEREQIEKIKKFLTEDFPETKTSVKSFQKSTSLPHSPHVTYPDLGHGRTLSFEDLNLNDLPDFSVYESKSETSHSKHNITYEFDPTISDTDDIKPLNDEDIEKFLITEPKIKTEIPGQVANSVTKDDLNQLDMEIENTIDTQILETAEIRKNRLKMEGSLHDLDFHKKPCNPINAPQKCKSTNLYEQSNELIQSQNKIPIHLRQNIRQNFKHDRSFLDDQKDNEKCKSVNAIKNLLKHDPDEIVDVESLSEAVALPVLQANNVHSLLEQFEATEKINKDTNSNQRVAQIVPQVYTKPKLGGLMNGMRIQDAALQSNQNKMNHMLITSSNNTQNPIPERKFHSDHDYCSPTKKQTPPFNPSKKRQSLLKPEVLTSNMLIKKSRYRACKDKKIIYNLSTDDEDSYSETISEKNNEKLLINSNHRKKQVVNGPLDLKPLKSVASVNTLIPLSAKTCDSCQTSSGSIKLTIKNKSKVILKLDCDASDKHSSLKLLDDKKNSNEIPGDTQTNTVTNNKSGLTLAKNNLNTKSDIVAIIDKQNRIVEVPKMHETNEKPIKSDTEYFKPIDEVKKEVESVINKENTFVLPPKLQKNKSLSEIKSFRNGCNSISPGHVIVKNEVVAVLKKENTQLTIPKIEVPTDEHINIMKSENSIAKHDIVNVKKNVGSIQTLETTTVKSKFEVQKKLPVIVKVSEVEPDLATHCQVSRKGKCVNSIQKENALIVQPIIDTSNDFQTKLSKRGPAVAQNNQLTPKKKPIGVLSKENKIFLKPKVSVSNHTKASKSRPVIAQSNRVNMNKSGVLSNENAFNLNPKAKLLSTSKKVAQTSIKTEKYDKTSRINNIAISNRGPKINQSTPLKIIPEPVAAKVIPNNVDRLCLPTKDYKDHSQNIVNIEKSDIKLEPSEGSVSKKDGTSNLEDANGSLYNGVFNLQETKNIVFNDTETMKSSENQLSQTIKKEPCDNKEENVEIKQPTRKKLNIQEYKKRKENGHSSDCSTNVSPDAIFPSLDKPLETMVIEKSEKAVLVAVQSIQIPSIDMKISPTHDLDDSKKIFDPILEASRKILLNTKKQKAEALRKRDESIVMSKIPKIENLELQPLISDVDMQKMANEVKIENLSNEVQQKEDEKSNNSIYEEIVLVSIGVNTDMNSEGFRDDTTVDEKTSINTINFKIKKTDPLCQSNVFEISRQKESERDTVSPSEEKFHSKKTSQLDEKRFKSATEALKQVERISDAKISSNSLFASIQDTVMKKASGFELNRSNNCRDGKRYTHSENKIHKSDLGSNKADSHKISQCVKNEMGVNRVKNEYTKKQDTEISSKPITILKVYPKEHGEDKVIIHLEKNRKKPCVSTIGTQTDLETYACVKSTSTNHSHHLDESRKRKINSSSSQEHSITISEADEKRTNTTLDDQRCDEKIKQEKRSCSKERPHVDKRSYSTDRYTRDAKKSRSMEKRYKENSRHTSEHRRDMNARKRSRSIDRHKYSNPKSKARRYRSNERRVRRRSRSRCRSKSYDRQRDRRHRKYRSRSRNYRKRSKSRSRNRPIKRERSKYRSRSRENKYEKTPGPEKCAYILDKELEAAEFVEKPEDVFDLEAPTAEDLMMPQIFRKPTLSVSSSDSSTSSTSTDSSTTSTSSSSTGTSSSSTTRSSRSIRSRSCASLRRRSASRESDASFRSERHQRFNDAGDTPVEERRIVFVGKLTADVTKSSLRKLFTRFGKINNVTIHTKDNGERYGFVTYGEARDAWAAVEGRNIAQLSRFDVGFGGRRAFCRHQYADLDRIEAEYEDRAYPIAPKEDLSFDQMLQEMKKKLSKRKKVDAP